MKVYFDTSVLVAALKAEHSDHKTAFAAIGRARTGEIEGYVAAHGLTEVYSVLTRASFEIPVYPDEALAMIEHSVAAYLNVVDVSRESYLVAIAACAKAGRKGGQAHDAVHVQAAVQAGCEVIYTFDIEQFRSLAAGWSGRIESPPAA